MAKKKSGRGSKAKKSQATAIQQASRFSPAAISQFVQEVKAEFSKIVWPEKKVVIGMTGFVVVLVIIISLYLGTVDLLLGKLVSYIIK